MNTAMFKRGLGLGMFLMGSVAYLEMVSGTLSSETVNIARLALFVFTIGTAIFFAFQLRKKVETGDKIEKIYTFPKFNKAPNKMGIFFFLVLVITFVMFLLSLFTNNTFPLNNLYMILFSNLFILYGLSFIFRILI